MTDAFEVPELTRGLRMFASPSGLGDAHDRFFSPLLDARRAAKAALRWPQRLSAFDAERIEATVRVILEGFAATEFPESAPDQRALAAELEDACDQLFRALRALEQAAVAVRAAADDTARAAPWGAWVEALRAVFVGADRGWEQGRAILGSTVARGQ